MVLKNKLGIEDAIDVSYNYEGYSVYKVEDLKSDE